MQTITFGKATLHLDFLPGSEDYIGSCYWETTLKALHDLHAVSDFRTADFEFYDRDPIWDPYEHDEDEKYGDSNADALIIFLAAAHYHGGEFIIDYHGSEYWFWHDAIHAEYDSGDGTDIYVDSDSEERALVQGAILAVQNGMELSEIFSELSAVKTEFKNRFGYEFDPISAFLQDSRVNVTIAM